MSICFTKDEFDMLSQAVEDRIDTLEEDGEEEYDLMLRALYSAQQKIEKACSSVVA